MNPFFRHRKSRDFAEAIRPELQSVATPDASPQLLERILASRAAGVRVILPVPDVRRAGLQAHTFVAVAAAAAALLVVPLIHRRATNANNVVSAPGLFGRYALAQQPTVSGGPALPPIALVNPGAIRPMKLQFSRRNRNQAGQLTSASIDNLDVSAADVAGTPAWRIDLLAHDVVATRANVTVETLFVARADLRLLRRAVHVAPYSRFQRINIEQRFLGDSVAGRMTTDGPSIGSGRAITRQLDSDFAPYLTDALAPLALMATHLTPTWKGSAALLGWAVIPKDIFVPIELRVDGEERLQLPAGVFDCWRISIRVAGRQIHYWARKSDGLGVRVFDSVHEVVLTKIAQ